MAMTGILRPGYVQLRVMDFEAALTHYRDHMGLELVRVANGCAYLRAYDEFDDHSVVLREADSPGLDRIGFKVAAAEDLDRFAERLRGQGQVVETLAADPDAALGPRISFVAPSGHRFDLYARMALSENGPLVVNPDIWRDEPRGMRIVRFDHCALFAQDTAATARIFVEALDFQVAEELVAPDGMRIGIFLSCSTKAHDIAFLASPDNGKIHHTSFLVESWHDVGHASDLIARHGISLDIGPTRHGITRGQTVYFFDPSGNRNEIFAGGYDFYPDNPTRRWMADEAGKAIFYYQKAVHDSFLSVAT